MSEDYKLKTNQQLLNQIGEFGNGFDEFHTRDIERIIEENEKLKKEKKWLEETKRELLLKHGLL